VKFDFNDDFEIEFLCRRIWEFQYSGSTLNAPDAQLKLP